MQTYPNLNPIKPTFYWVEKHTVSNIWGRVSRPYLSAVSVWRHHECHVQRRLMCECISVFLLLFFWTRWNQFGSLGLLWFVINLKLFSAIWNGVSVFPDCSLILTWFRPVIFRTCRNGLWNFRGCEWAPGANNTSLFFLPQSFFKRSIFYSFSDLYFWPWTPVEQPHMQNLVITLVK